MDDSTGALPAEFEGLVRDALQHLYDLAHLQTHPLAAFLSGSESGTADIGKQLRRALLDVIDALRPEPGVSANPRASRVYRILESRYIEGCGVEEVAEQIALSRSHYHREQARALQAVSSLVWQRWHLAARWDEASKMRIAKPEGSDLTRIEAESIVKHDAFDRILLTDIVRGVAGLLAPLCTARETSLQLDLPEELPTIPGDRIALRQILLVILAHAVGLTHYGVVTLRLAHGTGHVEVSISGTCAGHLRPDDLGMGETRPFVEALQGTITCLPSSTDLDRWTIRLTFPASAQRALLVVDNNEDFIGLVRRYLVGHDWAVVGALDVDQALVAIRRRCPQAILLDAVLPGRDGWDFLVELKMTPSTRDIPVIICSVLREPEVATSLGAVTYLQKPIEQGQLIQALDCFTDDSPGTVVAAEGR